MALSPGTRLGPYEIVSLISSGGMGEVYRARDTRLERTVAINPARFSFAHGGKDGTPFSVDRATYEKTIQVLHHSLERSKVDRSEKLAALKRLAVFET